MVTFLPQSHEEAAVQVLRGGHLEPHAGLCSVSCGQLISHLQPHCPCGEINKAGLCWGDGSLELATLHTIQLCLALGA